MRHMISAADAIARYVARGRAAFDDDSAIREAIVYQIAVIGEAAKAVVNADPELANDSPGVEWSLLAKMRDKIRTIIGPLIERLSGRPRPRMFREFASCLPVCSRAATNDNG